MGIWFDKRDLAIKKVGEKNGIVRKSSPRCTQLFFSSNTCKHLLTFLLLLYFMFLNSRERGFRAKPREVGSACNLSTLNSNFLFLFFSSPSFNIFLHKIDFPGLARAGRSHSRIFSAQFYSGKWKNTQMETPLFLISTDSKWITSTQKKKKKQAPLECSVWGEQFRSCSRCELEFLIHRGIINSLKKPASPPSPQWF